MLLATWNVNSLNVRLPHVISWLNSEKPDVLCIQETKMTDDKFPLGAIEDVGYFSTFFGEKSYNGVAILSKSKPSSYQKGFLTDQNTDSKRLLEVQIDNVNIINVYIPNGQEVNSDKFNYKLDWIKKLKCHLESQHHREDMVVICGDFNVAFEDRDVYSPQALAGQILFSDQEKNALEEVRQWGLVDTFRLHNKEAGLYSWWDYRMLSFRRKLGLRIDHIWASEALATKCSRSWIDIEPRKLEKPSDHAPVVSEFKI